MNQLERDRKINEINNLPGISDEQKQHRIGIVNEFYDKQESTKLTAASQAADRAEADLKDRLKRAYLQADPAATTDGFEKDYPELRSTYLREQALKRDQLARNASAAATRGVF